MVVVGQSPRTFHLCKSLLQTKKGNLVVQRFAVSAEVLVIDQDVLVLQRTVVGTDKNAGAVLVLDHERVSVGLRSLTDSSVTVVTNPTEVIELQELVELLVFDVVIPRAKGLVDECVSIVTNGSNTCAVPSSPSVKIKKRSKGFLVLPQHIAGVNSY